MKIQVTQEDIKAGKTGNPEFCPIGLAAKRAFGRTMSVGSSSMYPLDNCRELFLLPGSARDFIRRFDDYQKVEPFEFEVKEENE